MAQQEKTGKSTRPESRNVPLDAAALLSERTKIYVSRSRIAKRRVSRMLGVYLEHVGSVTAKGFSKVRQNQARLV
jgi:hypothetical protein